VVDTATHFTFFGQGVILALIETGGLGIMMFGTLLMLMAGNRLSVQSESAMMSTYGMDSVRSLRSLVWSGISLLVFFQAGGAALLAWRYLLMGYTMEQAVYHGVFHSISAFCNAGFALYPDNLTGLRHDLPYLLTVAGLVVCGGLGFLVLRNLATIKFWRRDLRIRGRVSLHTRIVLATTLVLILAGWAAFLALEWNGVLTSETWQDKLSISLFQSISPRTAGFNAVDMGKIGEPTRFVTSVLMFIGGSPGSMAGGIKTTTLVVLFLTLLALLRGRIETELENRTIPYTVVREALTIFLLYLLLVFASYGLLLLSEQVPPGSDKAGRLLFETISAYGTVGLSINLTPELSPAGRLVIAACMFVGRVGPLTLVMLMGSQGISQRVRFPEEDVAVG